MQKARNEIKFVCTEQELRLVESRIQHICKPDKHAGADGVYQIRSVYFDDCENTCFYENECGTDMREKYRIRIYNSTLEKIMLECKRKERDKNYKTSCPLSWEMCSAVLDKNRYGIRLNEGNVDWNEQQKMLFNKFCLQLKIRLFSPKIIVEYERTPYVYEQGNVRITFDRYIGFCKNIDEFGNKSISKRPVMSSGKHILEVKYDELLQDCLHDLFEDMNLQRSTFSKYYICRKFEY